MAEVFSLPLGSFLYETTDFPVGFPDSRCIVGSWKPLRWQLCVPTAVAGDRAGGVPAQEADRTGIGSWALSN